MHLFLPWANRLIEVTLGAQADPASVWIGLSTTVPNADGTNWNEVGADGYGGYARASLAGLMSIAGAGLALNNTLVAFPVPTSGGAVIAAAGLFSHPTQGVSLAGRTFKALAPAITIVAGRRPEIRASTLSISAS